MLKATFFGVPQIYYNHDALTGTLSGRCLALFAYLALANQPQDRGILADLLWSEIGEQQARQNLRYVLYDLRKIVGDYLIVTRNTIAFDRQKAHWIDANIFADYLAAKETLTEPALLQDLLHLYQDELLAGFVIQNAPGFEEWLTQQRETFRQQATRALLRLSNHYLSLGEYSAGLVVTQRLLQLEPWQEEAHRNQMCLLVFSGQRLAALHQYASCQQVLQAEFGAEPEVATTAIYQAIEGGKLTPPARPAHRVKTPTHGNWDAIPPTAPLYGRAEELTRLHHWLAAPQHRLVGLFGLTGQGKSALAAELVAQLAETAADHAVTHTDTYTDANHMEVLLWSSLHTFRTLPQLLQEWLTQLTKLGGASAIHVQTPKEAAFQPPLDEPQETVETLLQRLLTQLRRRRVLLVVDSGEMIYGATGPLTEYQPGWGAFDELLRRLADNEHQSCLLLISRITPTAWEALARRSSAVRTLALTGLSADASVALLQAGGRTVTPPLRTLAEQCVGHPQSLVTVRDLLDNFGIDLLTEPLTEPTLAGSTLRILQAQFAYLVPIEQSILHEVTLLPTPPTAATLWQQLPNTVTLVTYLEALHALQRQHWLLPSHAGAPLHLSPLVRRFLEQSSPHTPSQKSSATVKPQSDDGGQPRLRRPLSVDDEQLRRLKGQKGRKAEVAPSLYAARSVSGSDARAY
jgi:DNA-binding SARP family transcriptional activator